MTAEAEVPEDETDGLETFGGDEVADVSERPLVVEDVVKRFGGITAVDGASFYLDRGSLTGLIGPNGAGKTTTFNCITGIHEPDEGSVVFDGEDITGEQPFEIANRGLVRTFQIARELQGMTVL
jgi:branched-chain amino acid transport system ATP-binding protein